MVTNLDSNQASNGRGVRIRTLNAIMIVLVALCAFLFMQTAQEVSDEYERLQDANDIYISCELAASDLLNSSTYMTTQSRLFGTSYSTDYLENYFNEIDSSQHRERDMAIIAQNYPDSGPADDIRFAGSYSFSLQDREMYAMKLIVSALDLDVSDAIARSLDEIALKRSDADKQPAEMLEEARRLVTDESYEHKVNLIATHIDNCKSGLAEIYNQQKEQYADGLQSLYLRQQVLTWALLIAVLATVLIVAITVLQPLNLYIARITDNERLPERGAYEMRFLARAYNVIYEENQHTHKKLTHEAEHDPLTGLYNRGAFDKLIAELCTGPIALAIIDIDFFKDVNDTYGHECGDCVLKKVASHLVATFRSTDCCCRLGGDEMAVIMVDMAPELRNVISYKITQISDALVIKEDGIPSITVSIGIAFGDGTQSPLELYKNADEALYHVKEAGRDGFAFYDDVAAGL